MQAGDRAWGAQLRTAGVSALTCAALVLLFSLAPLLGARAAPACSPGESTPLECAELCGSEPIEESERGSWNSGAPGAVPPSLGWRCSARPALRSLLALSATVRSPLAFGRATPVRGPPLPLLPA
jgi:hypothetical protein